MTIHFDQAFKDAGLYFLGNPTYSNSLSSSSPSSSLFIDMVRLRKPTEARTETPSCLSSTSTMSCFNTVRNKKVTIYPKEGGYAVLTFKNGESQEKALIYHASIYMNKKPIEDAAEMLSKIPDGYEKMYMNAQYYDKGIKGVYWIATMAWNGNAKPREDDFYVPMLISNLNLLNIESIATGVKEEDEDATTLYAEEEENSRTENDPCLSKLPKFSPVTRTGDWVDSISNASVNKLSGIATQDTSAITSYQIFVPPSTSTTKHQNMVPIAMNGNGHSSKNNGDQVCPSVNGIADKVAGDHFTPGNDGMEKIDLPPQLANLLAESSLSRFMDANQCSHLTSIQESFVDIIKKISKTVYSDNAIQSPDDWSLTLLLCVSKDVDKAYPEIKDKLMPLKKNLMLMAKEHLPELKPLDKKFHDKGVQTNKTGPCLFSTFVI